jgi:hypothetical protein
MSLITVCTDRSRWPMRRLARLMRGFLFCSQLVGGVVIVLGTLALGWSLVAPVHPEHLTQAQAQCDQALKTTMHGPACVAVPPAEPYWASICRLRDAH